jgi:tetratricopeptide (TPR) repeat protein
VFFERFRQELRRYADGVHELGDPTPASVLERLPPPLRELYRSWNGLRLFTDSIVVEPVEGLARIADGFRAGESFAAPLEIDDAGHVYELDEAGDRVRVGSDLERWLAAVMAREALLVDREGEFKDVFDADALKPEVRKKRIRAGLKADPGSAAWHLEAAEQAIEAGEPDDARAALEAAVEADPQTGTAWEMLGALLRQKRALDEAERAFARAAEASRDPARQAERWAESARVAKEAGKGGKDAAARALSASTSTVESWLEQAKERLTEGDLDGAVNLAALVDAVKPTNESTRLLQQARSRRALKPI